MQIKGALKSTIAATAGDTLSRLLGFAAAAYLARVLGASSFGLMSIGLSILGYVVLCSSPGLHVIGTRTVAGKIEAGREFVDDLTSLRVVLASVCIGLTGCVGLVVSGLSGEWLVILVFVSSALPMGLSIDWYFQGKGRIATVAASKVLMFCVYLALVYILVRSPGDTVMVGIAYLAANSVSAVWLFSLFRREAGSMSFRWNPRRWRELVRQSIPLGASLLLSQSTANVPVLLAGTLLTAHETGLFSASMKLIVFCLMVDRIFYVVFFPVLTRYRQMRESQFPQLVAVGLKVMLAVSVPIFICGVAFAGMIVPVVFGSGYEEAVLVFQLLLPFFLFTTTNTVWMSVLYADSRDTDFLHVMILGSIVLIILCGVLSVILGIAGTAISISVSEGLMTVLLLMKGRKILSLRYGKIFLPLFISGAAMAGVLAAVQVIPSFAALLAALGCYAVLLVVLGGLTQNDIRFLKEKFV